MNILAHLHLAKLAGSSLIGNSVADFVKGDLYKLYPKAISNGIVLHRKIDALTDSMLEVKQAKLLFRKTHQRVAPITLDIVWDHFLSKHWQSYCQDYTLNDFNQLVKREIMPTIIHYPEDYQNFMYYLWQNNWLENYANLDFIGRVLHGMANRRPKLFRLRETIIDIQENYLELSTIFKCLYPKLQLAVTNKLHPLCD